MAGSADQPAKAPKKKKALAFLKSAPKTTPANEDDFDSTGDGGIQAENTKAEDDGLDMFRRSKDFWPQLIEREDDDPLKPASGPSSDDEPIPSASRSAKRRKMSSPDPVIDSYQLETYDDLYGPATPPRRTSRSATPSSRRKRPTPATTGPTEQSPPSIGKSRRKGKDRERAELVQSELLPSPTSRSTSQQLSADVVALNDDEGVFAESKWRDHTPSPQGPKIEPPSTSNKSDTPIVLEDSDDEFIDSATEPQQDEFEHFIAAARKKRDDAAKATAAAAAVAAAADDSESDNQAENSAFSGTRASRETDIPVVSIKVFVHSRIAAFAGVALPSPLFGCKRRIEHQLLPVKNAFVAWLRKYGAPLSEEMEQDIFLTWKGRRIYNSVSGLGLGWELSADGQLLAPDRTAGYDRGGVLLEAWTEDDFERHEAEQERQRLVARGDLVEEGGGVKFDGDEEEAEEPKAPKIRLFLTEKDKDPLGLSAFADTQVRVLIGAYKKQRDVPSDREIRLLYDGEWLDPMMTVEQADIEDRCTVEVYLK
ncbi:unnamed protein product [Discula destructiva]